MADAVQDFNTLISFLARRDIPALDKDALLKNNLALPDILILLGNSSLYTAETAFTAIKNGLAKGLLISGGRGHSTKYLVDNISKHRSYKSIKAADRAEADILKDIAVRFFGIPESKILVENKSTNCGSNAIESLALLRDIKRMDFKQVLLMQDPVLQRRTHASFEKAAEKDDVNFYSFASFVPLLENNSKKMDYLNKMHAEFCAIDRLVSLVMGEIPRLKDDEDGYGPKGKGFIVHVDIPPPVQAAFARLKVMYAEFIRN
jgi:uncharacterized SAM-binding protein YcdF (DUF218 family)